MFDDAPARTVGRPRSSEADEAITAATLALLADAGFEGVTVEAVAQRAGVARSTVYRRHPDRFRLIEAVLNDAGQEVAVADPDAGSVVDDLVTIAIGLRRVLTSTDFGRALPAIVAAAARYPQVSDARREFVATRRRVASAAVERGVARGEVDPDLDPEVLVDMVAGAVFQRTLVSRRAAGDEWIRTVVERAVRGCAPPRP